MSFCRRVKELVDDLRSDMFLALALDKFVAYVGDPITKDDVKACLMHDDTVKIVNVNGKEIVWLWSGWRLYDLIDKTVDLASIYGEAAVISEC